MSTPIFIQSAASAQLTADTLARITAIKALVNHENAKLQYIHSQLFVIRISLEQARRELVTASIEDGYGYSDGIEEMEGIEIALKETMIRLLEELRQMREEWMELQVGEEERVGAERELWENMMAEKEGQETKE